VLGLLLFAMYILPVGNMVAAHSRRYHQYVDDTQLYTAVQPGDDESFGPVSMCVKDVAGTLLPFRDTVKLLGVTLDSALTMDRHVTQVIHICSYHTRALRHIRPLITLDPAKMVGHSIVSSQLDYANALLHGTSTSNINKLQVAQN